MLLSDRSPPTTYTIKICLSSIFNMGSFGGALCCKLFRAFMQHILMDGITTFWLDGYIDVLWRLLHKFFKTFPHTPALWWGMGRESDFGKIYGGEINLCVHNFQVFIELSQWDISPSQSSLVIPIRLVILTSDAILLI